MSLKFYLFFLLAISVTTYGTDDDHHDIDAAKSRTKRGTFWDFFQKIVETGNLAVDQYNDTKNTLEEIYDLVADGFSDGKPTKRPPTTTTTTSRPGMTTNEGDETTTTTEKYRITKYEFGRIGGRNLRGLKRLLQIEINDALNQSHYNIAGYQREAKMVFSNSIVADTKAILKGIPVMPTMTTSNTTMTTNSTMT